MNWWSVKWLSLCLTSRPFWTSVSRCVFSFHHISRCFCLHNHRLHYRWEPIVSWAARCAWRHSLSSVGLHASRRRLVFLFLLEPQSTLNEILCMFSHSPSSSFASSNPSWMLSSPSFARCPARRKTRMIWRMMTWLRTHTQPTPTPPRLLTSWPCTCLLRSSSPLWSAFLTPFPHFESGFHFYRFADETCGGSVVSPRSLPP